jgi:hypothetical protein
MKHVPLSDLTDNEDRFSSYVKEVDLNDDTNEDRFTDVAVPISIKGLPPVKGQIHALTEDDDD